MKICTKTFLKFQIAMAIVTAILVSIYQVILCYATNERFFFDSHIIVCTMYTITYALFLFPAWRLWKGKNWYSLSLLFFSLISGLAVVSFIISLICKSDWGFILFWGVILLYIFYLPYIIISSCLIGFIGKYISNKYHIEIQ